MRKILIIALIAVAFAGCADSDADTPTDTIDETGTEAVAVQEPLQFTGNMVSIAEPVGTGAVAMCQFPGSCTDHEFTVDADNTNVTLNLVSTDGDATGVTAQALYGSDYDLFLLDGGSQIGSSTNPGDQADLVEITLTAGTYVAQVHSWNDIDGVYTLDITFS